MGLLLRGVREGGKCGEYKRGSNKRGANGIFMYSG